MEAANTDYALANFGPMRTRKGIGGPKTAAGKGRSSQNSRKHGCRSKEKILPGERRADYDALWEEWLGQYEAESAGDLTQLERIVDADWRLRRTERTYTKLERRLHKESDDPAEWPMEMLQRLQVIQRYRTNAENTLHKEVRLLENLKANRDGEQRESEREAAKEREERARWEAANPEQAKLRRQCEAEEEAKAEAEKQTPTPAEELFRGQNCGRPRTPEVRLEQCAEIRVVDGETVTELFPSNEELIEIGKAMLPPPTLVDRQLEFPQGIPAGYEWVGVQAAGLPRRAVSGWQRMSADTWLELIAREAEAGDGRLLPVQNLRPKERLACGCGHCVTYADIVKRKLERRFS